MKLKELKPIIYSRTGDMQICIVYDIKNNVDLKYGCSAEYAYEHYGDREIVRIQSVFENGKAYLVFSIK